MARPIFCRRSTSVISRNLCHDNFEGIMIERKASRCSVANSLLAEAVLFARYYCPHDDYVICRVQPFLKSVLSIQSQVRIWGDRVYLGSSLSLVFKRRLYLHPWVGPRLAGTEFYDPIRARYEALQEKTHVALILALCSSQWSVVPHNIREILPFNTFMYSHSAAVLRFVTIKSPLKVTESHWCSLTTRVEHDARSIGNRAQV